MAHEIETMFSHRETPWHGLGKIVQNAPSSAEAIRLAGLDWTVNSRPIFLEDGSEISGFKANVRDIDNSTLGITSDKYKIIQNSEAFAFTDHLLGENVRYETAGSLFEGRKIWLLAKTQGAKILGDDYDNYFLFTNDHTSLGALVVAMTSVRVVCNNTLNLALKNCTRKFSITHVGDINTRLENAKLVMNHGNEYLENLKLEADKLANFTLTQVKVRELTEKLFPLHRDSKPITIKNIEAKIAEFEARLNAPDLSKFKGTGWGFIQAASDFDFHSEPKFRTPRTEETRFMKLINGGKILDKAYDLISA